MPEYMTIAEIVEAAQAKLDPVLWDHSCGGADGEVTLRRNRSAFDHLAFRPRVLVDVRQRETATTFLGHRISLPVMLAPVGSIGRFHPDGALACGQAADRAGTIAWVGAVATPSLEEVRDGTVGPLIFQMYVRGDRNWMRELVARVESAGYAALCLTVDSAVYGRRDRDLRNRFFPRASRPRPDILPSDRSSDIAPADYQAALNWTDVAWLVEASRLPVVLKGILSPEDAVLAVEHGVAAVYVSNHGGRQLDHAPSTIEVLPEIASAVQGRAEIIVDSGFMRGSDVVKALALGARAVVIGKLMTWALAAGGVDGLVRTLEILKDEIDATLANLGTNGPADVSAAFVRASFPPSQAPWPVSGSVGR